jgi:uncharacterized protein (DUF2249 family)
VITVDARGYMPPETFDLAIDALASLEPVDTLLLIADREPIALYEFLAKNSYRYETQSFPDGRYEVRITELP